MCTSFGEECTQTIYLGITFLHNICYSNMIRNQILCYPWNNYLLNINPVIVIMILFILCYCCGLFKVIKHCIFRNLKAFLHGEEHRMYFCNIPVLLSKYEVSKA